MNGINSGGMRLGERTTMTIILLIDDIAIIEMLLCSNEVKILNGRDQILLLNKSANINWKS